MQPIAHSGADTIADKTRRGAHWPTRLGVSTLRPTCSYRTAARNAKRLQERVAPLRVTA